MLHKKHKLALAFAGLLATQVVWAGGASPAMLGNTCAGCHGTLGLSMGAAPSLKGLPKAYLVKAMQDFRSGARPATIMDRIAKGYDDADLDALASYFADMR